MRSGVQTTEIKVLNFLTEDVVDQQLGVRGVLTVSWHLLTDLLGTHPKDKVPFFEAPEFAASPSR